MVHEQVKVLDVQEIAKDICRLRLFAPQIVSQNVRPGQFLHLGLPGNTQHLLRRPISIMSVQPDSQCIDLVIQKVGAGSRMLCELQAGAELSVIGPLGVPFDSRGAKHIIFVGGGVGVAPVRCAMDVFVRNGPGCEAIALFGFRSAEYAYGLGNAPCEVRVATDDGSLGQHALVTDLLKDAMDEQKPDLIVACGPIPMLRTIQNLAVREHIACQISLEEFMACGIGACLVCSCKTRVHSGSEYRRVCVDGPVFDAKEVCFDG